MEKDTKLIYAFFFGMCLAAAFVVGIWIGDMLLKHQETNQNAE